MSDRVKLEAHAPAKRKDEAVEAAPMPVSNASKYKPEHCRTARFMAQRGAIQDEIAECLGVSTRTVQNWMAQIPEFQDAMAVGVEAFNTRVERSLAECALGYWVTWEEEITLTKRSTAQDGTVVVEEQLKTVTRRKYYPPSNTAQIFFLKNRLPDRYRDVQDHRVQTELPSSQELLGQLSERIMKLAGEGLLTLPAPRKMKEINPRTNGQGNGHG